MPRKAPAPLPPANQIPSPSAGDGWDDPADHDNGVAGSASGLVVESEPETPQVDLHDKQSAAIQSLSNRQLSEPPAPAAAPAQPVVETSQLDALNAQIKELQAQLAEARQPAKPKADPLKLELPDTADLDPEFRKSLQSFVEAANKRNADLEEQVHKLESKVGQRVGELEAEQRLTAEERKLTKLLDELPSEHYRMVFEGDEAADNYRAAAAEVQALREFDKSVGRKRTDAQLFKAASINLFTEKADAIRARGGRPRKDRTIARATSPNNPPTEYGVRAAKQAYRAALAEHGNRVLDGDDEDDRGY
jgi:hypothetical protein